MFYDLVKNALNVRLNDILEWIFRNNLWAGMKKLLTRKSDANLLRHRVIWIIFDESET